MLEIPDVTLLLHSKAVAAIFRRAETVIKDISGSIFSFYSFVTTVLNSSRAVAAKQVLRKGDTYFKGDVRYLSF